MTAIGDILDALQEWAPFETAEDFDNCGLLIGERSTPLTHCLLALDFTQKVCGEARKKGAELVVTHHPVIFRPLKRLDPGTVAYRAVQAGIGVICAHTNLDKAPGGVSDTLCEMIGLREAEDVPGGDGCVKIGTLPQAMNPVELAELIKERLSLPALRLYDAGGKITKIALCSGGGGSFVHEVIASGADAYLTGDVKHDAVVDAANAGLTMIDAGHYETEEIILEPLREYLEERFPGIIFERAASDQTLFTYLL